MKNRNMNFQNLSFNSNLKLSNRNRINSSLNNISKQLNNISLNDVNILNLKYGRKKMNSTNKINRAHSHIYSSKSCKGKSSIYKFKPFNINDSFDLDNNLIIDNIESFSILNNTETKLNLRKKNLILKENLKFLLNEVKKYKKSEKDNSQIKEYEEQIEYYINELDKLHKEIILLKEKYITVIKENEELKKYINYELNKLNNSQLLNSLCKTEENKPPYEKLNKIKNLNSFRYLNLNLKNYMDKFRKNNTNKNQISAKTSRNINKSKNKNDNYLLIEDNNEGININKNNNNNKSEIFQRNALKKINNNLKSNNQNILQKLKTNYNKNINQIIFKRIENKTKIHNNINKTLSKNKINQNSLKDNSFEINKSINLSQSFRYFNDSNNNKLQRKKIYLNKYNNYIYFNNQTFNDN
jgi:hypothetical protein